MTALAVLGPLLLLALVSARVDARSPTSAHAHVFLAQELVLVAGAALLATVAALMKARVRRDAVSLAVGALILVEVASVAASSNPWLAVRSATVWLSGLLVFVIARAIAGSARDLAVAALLVPLAVVAGSVVLEALGVVHLSARHHSPGGLLGERNVAAELLVAGAPAIAWTCLADGPGWRRRAALGVAVLAACAVVLTRTRSAWLAALVLAASALACSGIRRRLGRPAAAAALGVALALLLPTTLRWRSAHPYHDSLVHLVDPSTPSAAGRIVQYATTWRMAGKNPVLGVGPGSWAASYLSFAEHGDPTVHEGLAPVNRLPNGDVLGFAAERGFLAFGALTVLALLLVLRRDPPLRGLRLATLLVVAIMASLDAVLQTPAALLLVAWVMGVSSAPAAAEARYASRLPFALAAAVLLLAAVPARGRITSLELVSGARGSDDLDRAARLDPGDVALRLFTAESWIEGGRCDLARPHLDAATRFSPASPAAGELRARCSGVSFRIGRDR